MAHGADRVGSADDATPDGARPRPRPVQRPGHGATLDSTGRVASSGSAESDEPSAPFATPPAAPSDTSADQPHGRPSARRRGRRGAQLARIDQQSTQVVTAAGSAVVTAARVGRLLGRVGWRLARQLPGVDAVETQAQRLRAIAATELLRMLELPQQMLGSSEEQRAMTFAQQGAGDPEPLRSAMTELLERAGDHDPARSRDYLFGTIVSQLVPDEARILAVLARGVPYAVVDVRAKPIGRSARTVLANASTVGAAAAISTPADTATHLTRLQRLGLLDISTDGADAAELSGQFDDLEQDDAVRTARGEVDKSRQGSAKLVRKTVRLSELGIEFWTACAPDGAALARRQH